MKKLSIATLLMFAVTALAQNTASGTTADPWKSIGFLEGTWTASAQGAGGAVVSGRYSFVSELSHHVMARHSTTDPKCQGPATFDCAHDDLLYIFQDAPAQPLKAIYFDNEGHVIHYEVSAPDAATAVFLSEPGPGPRFRLVYRLSEGVMSGKFQMQMPGQNDWKSYLEWSGSRI